MVLALIVALFSCRIPERPGAPQATARDAYLSSLCRLHSNATCVDNQDATCEVTRDFSTRHECIRWYQFEYSDCDAILDDFIAFEDLIRECAADLDDIDCRRDDLCDEEGAPAFRSEACHSVDRIIEQSCDGLPSGIAY